MATMQKATADENPMHSGMGFSPASLPFLLISNPKICFASMNCLTFGMRDLVMYQLTIPAATIHAMLRVECLAMAKMLVMVANTSVNWN